MAGVCPNCSREFSNLPTHWRRSSCNRLHYHPHQIELMEGLLLGDGTITKYPPSSNFQIGSTNHEFLEWLEAVFGPFSGEVCFSESAEDIARRNRESGFSENADASNYNDYYKLRTMADQRLNSLRDRWYPDDSKKIPEDFQLTARSVKMWYVCDGSKKYDGPRAVNPSANFSNVSFDTDRCVELLQELGIDARAQSGNWIRATSESSIELYERMGNPVPGFEYKWP